MSGDDEVSGIGLIEALPQHLPGEIEGNHETLVHPRFEPSNSRISLECYRYTIPFGKTVRYTPVNSVWGIDTVFRLSTHGE
jgi:hypothetical protein